MALTVFLLCLLGAVLLFAVGRRKGFRALISLGLTIFAFIEIVIPMIVRGHSPVLVVLAVALPLLALIVYCTEGFGMLSHLAIIAAAMTFALTSLLTEGAVMMAHLTGLVSDETSSVGASGIDLRQLLAAGILLGTLGVLTEMVVTQVATVFELAESKSGDSFADLSRRARTVGMAHLGSIITTLFLIYAGASLPLLVIFMGAHGALANALSYEPLVDEIIRTLIGTIGLVLAMPISTYIAVRWLCRKVPAATHVQPEKT